MKTSSLLIIPVIGTALLLAACNQKSNAGHPAKDATAKEAVSQTAALPGNNQQLCDTHKAPRNICFICDASLRDTQRLWCKEHNRYEDRCFTCHPESQDTSRLYCKEHGLYEDECFICHPEITKG